MRIGVAGAGLIGRRHIELIEASPDCVVAGIADPSDAAKEFAAGAQHSLVSGSPRIARAAKSRTA